MALFILGGIGGVYYYYSKKKSENIFTEEGPRRPPEEVAYERLERLQKMGLLDEGNIKEYYILLSEIIRKYLGSKYDIPVLDRTTYEVFVELRKANIDKKNTSYIKEFLEECDLVKFARYKPENKIIEEEFLKAREIIDRTRNR